MSNNTNQAPQQWNSRFGYIMVAGAATPRKHLEISYLLYLPGGGGIFPDRLHNCYCIDGTPMVEMETAIGRYSASDTKSPVLNESTRNVTSSVGLPTSVHG